MPVDIGVFGLAPARSTLAVVLVLTCGVATTGCTRTDDGSMMLSRPSMSLGFGRLSERFAERRRARAQQIAASQQVAEPTAFPPPPSPPVVEAAAPKPQVTRPAPVRRAAQPARAVQPARSIRRGPIRATDVRAPRIGVKAPFQGASGSAKPLNCTDMAEAAKAGGRVKVSCQ